MENQLKCALLLSLKDLALRRVAVLYFIDSGILASVSKFRSPSRERKEARENIENKIKDKMLKLELPETLTNQMIDIVGHISSEVFVWKCSQPLLWDDLNGTGLPESVKLCWTTSGTINYRRTAEQQVRCEKLDVELRYELACYNCLEDYISLYWDELPEEKKRMYDNCKDPLPSLPYCWPYILKGQQSELDYLVSKSDRNLTSFYQFAFEDSAKDCCKTAAEYFFQKLKPEEREASLMRTFHALKGNLVRKNFNNEKYSKVLFYLLSLMTPELQIQAIKSEPVFVFSCFLHWPLQDLFLENKGLLWSFLQPSSYDALLDEMIVGYDSSDFCFPKIFQEFFRESPQDLKKCLVDGESDFSNATRFSFLVKFFEHDDSESIKIMFRNMDAEDRVKLVSQRRVLQHFLFSMANDWHLVEVCLREATLSKEEKGRLKDAFAGNFGRGVFQFPKLKRFLQFLDETSSSSDERKNCQKRKLGARPDKSEARSEVDLRDRAKKFAH